MGEKRTAETSLETAMQTIGLEELETHVSEYVGKARQGEHIIITEDDREVATLAPVSAARKAMLAMCRDGRARWNGGKPAGLRGCTIKGDPLSKTILDERRWLEVHERSGEDPVFFTSFDLRLTQAARDEHLHVLDAESTEMQSWIVYAELLLPLDAVADFLGAVATREFRRRKKSYRVGYGRVRRLRGRIGSDTAAYAGCATVSGRIR